jgi:hypothetical protein
VTVGRFDLLSVTDIKHAVLIDLVALHDDKIVIGRWNHYWFGGNRRCHLSGWAISVFATTADPETAIISAHAWEELQAAKAEATSTLDFPDDGRIGRTGRNGGGDWRGWHDGGVAG